MISESSSNPLEYQVSETSPHLSQISIGGVSVQFTSLDQTAVTLLAFSQRFQTETDTPDITVQIEWLAALPMTIARPLFDSGCTWRLFDAGEQFQFDFYAPICGGLPHKRLVIDRQFSRARLQMNEKVLACLPQAPSPLEYPLDELLIMHRLTQEKAIEVHGCGIVGASGVGNLFVGHSGAGKSTTTRLWNEQEDVKVLSDDRIIVRRDDATNDAGPHTMRMYGTPWHGEGLYASPESAPLARIFILEHGHGNVLTRLSPSQAMAELFARSFVPFHRHEYVESALAFLQEVVGAIPCYRYAFEPNQRAVDVILNFHD
jgi:hypothetical protein